MADNLVIFCLLITEEYLCTFNAVGYVEFIAVASVMECLRQRVPLAACQADAG